MRLEFRLSNINIFTLNANRLGKSHICKAPMWFTVRSKSLPYLLELTESCDGLLFKIIFLLRYTQFVPCFTFDHLPAAVSIFPTKGDNYGREPFNSRSVFWCSVSKTHWNGKVQRLYFNLILLCG